MKRNFIVKPIVTAMSLIEYERMYGVFEYVEDIGIHTKDEYADCISMVLAAGTDSVNAIADSIMDTIYCGDW